MACSASPESPRLMAASCDRMLVSIDSCQRPTRVNVCAGMWRACGASGARSRVPPGVGQTARGERRNVVAVNQIVRDAWMIRFDPGRDARGWPPLSIDWRRSCRSAAHPDRPRGHKTPRPRDRRDTSCRSFPSPLRTPSCACVDRLRSRSDRATPPRRCIRVRASSWPPIVCARSTAACPS